MPVKQTPAAVFGFQGQPNRPERIVKVLKPLCTLRNEPAELIKKLGMENACQIFS